MHIFVFLVHILTVLSAYLHAYFTLFKCITIRSLVISHKSYATLCWVWMRRSKTVRPNFFMVIKAEICRGGLEGRIFLWSLRPKFAEGGLKAEFIYGH